MCDSDVGQPNILVTLNDTYNIHSCFDIQGWCEYYLACNCKESLIIFVGSQVFFYIPLVSYISP